MTAIRLSALEIDTAILEEAADWLVLLHSGEVTDQDRADLAGWRARSAAHEAAWQRAQSVLETFQQVPSGLGRDALSRLPSPGRRELLGLLMLALPAAWLTARYAPWQQWTADLRTASGEQKAVTLVDGTRVVLNTATAVDVSYTSTERRLTLIAGEIFITTAQDAQAVPRPLVVSTDHGTLQPLGTAFNVRSLDATTRLAVLEGAVEVRPLRSIHATVVRAGEQLVFTADTFEPAQPIDANVTLWERGMLLARDMTLGELIAELNRYHRGVLRCDPAVAGLRVSGSFSLTDIPASLALLENTLPLRIGRTTSYWITIQGR